MTTTPDPGLQALREAAESHGFHPVQVLSTGDTGTARLQFTHWRPARLFAMLVRGQRHGDQVQIDARDAGDLARRLDQLHLWHVPDGFGLQYRAPGPAQERAALEADPLHARLLYLIGAAEWLHQQHQGGTWGQIPMPTADSLRALAFACGPWPDQAAGLPGSQDQ